MKTFKNFQPKLIIPVLFTVMVLCMGCPYEAAFPLEGTRVKYDKDLIGTWHEGETDLKITRIDDYKFSFYYNDHDDEYGTGEERGTGYAIINNGATYLIGERSSTTTKKFVIYKVVTIESSALNLIPLAEDDISSTKTFSSAKDFTSFVLNSSAFSYINVSEFEKGSAQLTDYTPPVKNNNSSYSGNASGNVLFSEDFQENTNGWYSNYTFKDSNYIYISTLDDPNHFYLFRNRRYSRGYMVPIPYYSIPTSNYSIEVNARHYDGVENSGYGIKFGASDWQNCYNINISANGYYRISKNVSGDYSEIVPWTKSSLLNTGSSESNKIEVRVYSGYAEVYMNGSYLKRIDNFSSYGKNAGLEVYNNQTVYFDDLYIKSLSGGSSTKPANSNNSYSSGNTIFSEDFQENTNGWYSNYTFKDSNYIYISTLDDPNHFYLFRNRKYRGSYIVPIPFYSIPSSNYSITINARHYDGVDDSGYGIKFGASDWENTYSFNISNNGYYRISKTVDNSYSEIVGWTKSSALNTGSETNKLEVRVYGTYAEVYINGTYISRISNFSSFGKYAGLEVFNNQTVYFDDLTIKKL
jgi:hypothetical protein